MRRKIGVITNPRSHRNKTGIADIQAAFDGKTDVLHEVLTSIEDVPGILAEFARREVGVVVPNGGDGTVVAVLTELFEHRPIQPLPCIAVLPRGLTNMIADDVGLQGSTRAGLANLLRCRDEGTLDRHVVERALIRMEGAKGHPPQVGLFFGAAGLTRAILASRKVIHRRGLGARIAGGLLLARVLGRGALGLRAEDSVFDGDRIGVKVDDAPIVDGSYLMVLVTTLDRMLFRSRPFWGTGSAPLRYTAVRYPPRQLLRAIRPLMYGGSDRTLPNDDYLSQNAQTISLRMTCPFTLDGEMFEPDPDRPVILSGEHRAEFIRV